MWYIKHVLYIVLILSLLVLGVTQLQIKDKKIASLKKEVYVLKTQYSLTHVANVQLREELQEAKQTRCQ